MAPPAWSGLSLAVGLALAEALDPTAVGPERPRIGLKWPNDLWLWEGPGRGRKLGGILIETVVVGARRMCIVGVGLNVLPQEVKEASQGYACMAELSAVPTQPPTAPQTLARLALPLVRTLLRFEAEGLTPEQLAAYARRDVLLDQPVVASDGSVQGLARGLAADGAMRVQLPNGQEQLLLSGDVGLRVEGSASAADAGQ